ncbi:MAG: hypothetical protein ACOCT9_00775 [archaeon]
MTNKLFFGDFIRIDNEWYEIKSIRDKNLILERCVDGKVLHKAIPKTFRLIRREDASLKFLKNIYRGNNAPLKYLKNNMEIIKE